MILNGPKIVISRNFKCRWKKKGTIFILFICTPLCRTKAKEYNNNIKYCREMEKKTLIITFYHILYHFPIQFCVLLCINCTGKRSGISVSWISEISKVKAFVPYV